MSTILVTGIRRQFRKALVDELLPKVNPRAISVLARDSQPVKDFIQAAYLV